MGFLKHLGHKISHTAKGFGKAIHHGAVHALDHAKHLDQSFGKFNKLLDNGYTAAKKGIIDAAGAVGAGQEARTAFHALSASPIGAAVGAVRGELNSIHELGKDSINMAESKVKNDQITKLLNS